MSAIKKMIPLPAKKYLKKRQRRLELWIKKLAGRQLNATMMAGQLNELGIETGARVLVHSSLKSLGFVEHGANTVIEGFRLAIGSDGLLCMPGLTLSPTGGVGAEISVTTMPRFDIRTTPSGVGVISETFRKEEGVIRSLHPTHSICAFGPGAIELSAGHHNCRFPFGPGSPWQQMAENRFVFVFLGASVDSMTFAHVIEDNDPAWPLSVYDEEEYVVPCQGYDGNLVKVSCWVHQGTLAREFRQVSRLMKYFDALPGTRKGKVGEAEVLVMNSDEVYTAYRQALAEGHTIYGTLDTLESYRKKGGGK